jgi:ribosome-binding protein aMBF1 (putative translation factor)
MRKIVNKVPKKTSDGLAILNRMMGKSSKMKGLVENARVNAAVAQLIYNAREKAGLTQKELAELVGTKQPVIARLEDADYEGHSLAMLQRIATALNQRLEINLRPLPEKKVA